MGMGPQQPNNQNPWNSLEAEDLPSDGRLILNVRIPETKSLVIEGVEGTGNYYDDSGRR